MSFRAMNAVTKGKSKWKVRQRVQSFVKKLVSPEKEQKLEETRNDMKCKKNEIIHLIKHGDDAGNRQLLLERFEDYDKQSAAIYESHSNLSRQLKDRVKQEEGGFWSDIDAESSPEDEKRSLKIRRELWDLNEEENRIWKPDHAPKLEAVPNQNNEINGDQNNVFLKQESTLERVEEGERSQEESKSTGDRLKNERDRFELELVAAKQEIFSLKQQLDTKKEETIYLNSIMRGIAEEVKLAQDRVDELEAECNLSMEKFAQVEREKVSLREALDRNAAEALAKMKALEDVISNYKIELDSLQRQKRESEEQPENKTVEVRQLRSDVRKLEMTVSKKEDTVTASAPSAQSLMVHVAHLELELEAARAQTILLEEQIVRQGGEKVDLEMELRSLKLEVAALVASQKITEEEKEALSKKVAEMAHEIKQAQDLEAEVKKKEDEKREAIRQLCIWFDYRMERLREKYSRMR